MHLNIESLDPKFYYREGIMPKRKAPLRKKTLAETDRNVDSTDSAVAVPSEPAPPPTKKTRVERAKNTKSGRGVVCPLDHVTVFVTVTDDTSVNTL